MRSIGHFQSCLSKSISAVSSFIISLDNPYAILLLLRSTNTIPIKTKRKIEFLETQLKRIDELLHHASPRRGLTSVFEFSRLQFASGCGS